MKTLNQLSAESGDYIRKHLGSGGTSEFDQSINDISQEKIVAMKREKGACWMFKINRYKTDADKPFIVEYTGQKVYNFEYAAIVPCNDGTLVKFLSEYNKNNDPRKAISLLTAIQDRITALDGRYLIWA